jgi:major membrane immunogen (membrane-anchored lipoprotein)
MKYIFLMLATVLLSGCASSNYTAMNSDVMGNVNHYSETVNDDQKTFMTALEIDGAIFQEKYQRESK